MGAKVICKTTKLGEGDGGGEGEQNRSFFFNSHCNYLVIDLFGLLIAWVILG